MTARTEDDKPLSFLPKIDARTREPTPSALLNTRSLGWR